MVSLSTRINVNARVLLDLDLLRDLRSNDGLKAHRQGSRLEGLKIEIVGLARRDLLESVLSHLLCRGQIRAVLRTRPPLCQTIG